MTSLVPLCRCKPQQGAVYDGWLVGRLRLCSHFADKFRSEIILLRNDLSTQNAKYSGIICPHYYNQNGTTKLV